MENNQEKSVQENMIFNTVGSLIYYVCQWAITVIIVRISGYEDAGILAIAMSVTAAPAIVGLFNIRSYQVSDVEDEYSTGVYIRSRVYTNIASYIICIIMILLGGYNLEKSAVILFFMLFKVAEGFADVYYGAEQKRARMDYAGISLTIRGIGTIVLFVGAYLVTHSMLVSIIAISVFSMAVVLVYDRRIVGKWTLGETKPDLRQVWKLIWVCCPLAIVAYCNNLSINIPKIYLEQFFGSEVMGYYSSVASPTVVIQLAATTVFAPLVPILADQFNQGKKRDFLNTMKKFSLLVLGLSVICLIGSKLLARWGLTLLFGADIDPYVYLFVPVIIVSILIAINASLFSVCTLLREIKKQYIIAAVGLAASEVLSLTIVRSQSMMGVVYALVISLLAQILVQIAIIGISLHKMEVKD